MFTEIEWDHEVDVVCIGAEASVLAAGIVAATAGFDVYLGIAEPSTGRGELADSLSYTGADSQTSEHLGAFDYAFDEATRRQACWPVRAVDEIEPTRTHRHGAVEPFFGASLDKWARRCAAAPSGLLYNRVAKRQMTEMRSSARGEKIEAAVVGSIQLSPDLPAVSLLSWLRNRAEVAGLRPLSGVRLIRLVFDENGVAGAVLDTADGVQAVRARDNLIIGVGDPSTERLPPLVSGYEPVTVHVSLVSKTASRFGELELITAAEAGNRLAFTHQPSADKGRWTLETRCG